MYRSFVPPVRDEESETQRKAHAKRVRETRRSTQGVTLDEIKSAEQLVKKKQQNNESSALTPSSQVKYMLVILFNISDEYNKMCNTMCNNINIRESLMVGRLTINHTDLKVLLKTALLTTQLMK